MAQTPNKSLNDFKREMFLMSMHRNEVIQRTQYESSWGPHKDLVADCMVNKKGRIVSALLFVHPPSSLLDGYLDIIPDSRRWTPPPIDTPIVVTPSLPVS
jgi:hypothetical protein